MSKKVVEDLYGKAILDHLAGEKDNLYTFSSLAGKDELPLQHLFRSYQEMPPLEQKALQCCYGTVLDIGCGAGSHSLVLQENNLETCSIDISEGAIEACKRRGLKSATVQDIWQLHNRKFDSIICLMNGIGICGTLHLLSDFLLHLKSLLHPGGQVLIDSSDIIYMFEDDNGNMELPDSDHYYGEVRFHFQYKQQQSPAFDWLYIDYPRLETYATEIGLSCEKICEGAHFDYLARLSLNV